MEYFKTIPDEIIADLSKELDLPSLNNFSRVSHKFWKICNKIITERKKELYKLGSGWVNSISLEIVGNTRKWTSGNRTFMFNMDIEEINYDDIEFSFICLDRIKNKYLCKLILDTRLPNRRYIYGKEWKSVKTYRDLFNFIGGELETVELPDGTTVRGHRDGCILTIEERDSGIHFMYGR